MWGHPVRFEAGLGVIMRTKIASIGINRPLPPLTGFIHLVIFSDLGFL